MKAYDLIVLGTGPAGLQAAIHAARAKISVMVLGRQPRSSLFRAHIENYCCLSGVSGGDLLLEGRRQAEKFGAEFLNEDVIEASSVMLSGFQIKTESGEDLAAHTLILGMGISRNKLNVPGEKELLGRGVSYCVDCDANFFRGLPVAVVGSGSAAASGALTLLFYANEVHLVTDKLDVNERLADQLRASAIVLHDGVQVKSIDGQAEVQGLTLSDESRLDVKGVFIELGAKGAVELAGRLGVNLDPQTMQYVVTGKKQETNVPGIYAAGDITGPPWQMAKAVGEGCVAGLEAAAYVKKLRPAAR
jgi:thioredoxin reductase (NADPH)